MGQIKWIDFQRLGDERGDLVALEIGMEKAVPFEIKRVYYIYRTAEGVSRGYHAHKKLKQVAICISGMCRMILDDGRRRDDVWLNNPTKGLLIESMTWREMHDFSDDCVLLVLASEHYDEADYIRDYQEFIKSRPQVDFVPYDEKFLEKSWEWLNDPELMKLTLTKPFTREQQSEFYSSLASRDDYKIWGIRLGGEKIGAVGLKKIAHGESAEYFGYIGDKSYWGKGVSSYMFGFIVSFAKEQKLKRIYLEVSKSNDRAVSSYRKNGFSECEDRGDTIIMELHL